MSSLLIYRAGFGALHLVFQQALALFAVVVVGGAFPGSLPDLERNVPRKVAAHALPPQAASAVSVNQNGLSGSSSRSPDAWTSYTDRARAGKQLRRASRSTEKKVVVSNS